MSNRKAALFRAFILWLSALLLLTACTANAEDFLPFIRIDGNDPDAWMGELDNVRILKAGLYEYKKVDLGYGIAPDYIPNSKGLDTLCISGSAQFSAQQFHALADTLRAYAGGGRTIYIFDLRQESHVLVNEGFPFFWYGLYNWANDGMTLDEIEADETARFGAMIGTTVSTYCWNGKIPVNETTISVEKVMTEKELVENEGFSYFRLPIRDYAWPAPEIIDAFVSFVKSIDPDQVWLHFHCAAGKGRTGIMMMIYDMMMNPDVSMEDAAIRQAMLGGSYVLYAGNSKGLAASYFAETSRLTPLFYEYVQQQRELNYEVPWSVWLTEREAQAPVA